MADNDFSLKETSPNIGGGRISGGEKLTSSFDLVEQMKFLYVRVLKAKDLPPHATTKSCDSFIDVEIGNYMGKTKVIDKQSNPEWNEVFAFTKERLQGTRLEIAVRYRAGDLIGKLAFEVKDIPTRVPPDSPLASQWYRLEDKDDKKITGELMLSIWFGTQADEVFPEAWHSDAAAVSGQNIIKTRSKVYLSPKLWYLRVNIIQAQDLISVNKNKNPEVFIKAALGNVVARSRPSFIKSVNPTWNEDILFVAVEPFDETLYLSVEDRVGKNKEECLGKCEIKLSQVERRNTTQNVSDLWYNLELQVDDKKKEGKFVGRLNLRVSLDGGYHVLDESIQYSSDYRPSTKLLASPPIGRLELGVLSASGLLPMKSRDGRGTTDAYCVAKYGPKWVKTRTIVDSFVPKWNEQYTWEVYDPYTVLTIAVFDNSQIGNDNGNDPRIGKVRIRLSTLETDRIYTHSYPLIVLQPNGVKKMGEIELAVRFTCPSMVEMLQAHVRPLLPRMHYVHPLSVLQLESLRHQATHIMSSRLGRAEPPLRKEVVEYMLDVGSNMWSLRRGRANYERLYGVLKGLMDAWDSFDQICRWKKPTTTILMHCLFLLLVLYPSLVLILVFFIGFTIGMVRYRRRPRHPPHMDIQLSRADVATPEELDEEFDTFPSSRPIEIMKLRYDRLRGIGSRLMIVMGDLATQGERVENLLSWRDPRATFVFALVCLLACVLIYLVTLTGLVIFGGLYVMRHPTLRSDVPSIPHNLFRRLPTKADSLL